MYGNTNATHSETRSNRTSVLVSRTSKVPSSFFFTEKTDYQYGRIKNMSKKFYHVSSIIYDTMPGLSQSTEEVSRVTLGFLKGVTLLDRVLLLDVF